jgi:hypothetical protein
MLGILQLPLCMHRFIEEAIWQNSVEKLYTSRFIFLKSGLAFDKMLTVSSFVYTLKKKKSTSDGPNNLLRIGA